VKLLSSDISLEETAALMNRNAAAKVRQRKINATIASVSRTQQRKERLVLIDRQELAVAESPTLRRKIKTNNLDFSQEWC
jgi:hypothetical protein